MPTLARPGSSRSMRGLVVLATLGIAACTSSPAATAPPSASAAALASQSASAASIAPAPASAETSPTSSPSAAAASGGGASGATPTAVPTSIDPCKVVSADEAGRLAGASFGAGKESTTKGNARICTYGAQTLNVFSVVVAIAPDAATAQADEKNAEAELQANAAKLANQGLHITKLPNFAPGADAVLMDATISMGGNTVGARAIYVLHGTTFFGLSDIALDAAPPTTDALKSEAMTVMGRLP